MAQGGLGWPRPGGLRVPPRWASTQFACWPPHGWAQDMVLRGKNPSDPAPGGGCSCHGRRAGSPARRPEPRGDGPTSSDLAPGRFDSADRRLGEVPRPPGQAGDPPHPTFHVERRRRGADVLAGIHVRPGGRTAASRSIRGRLAWMVGRSGGPFRVILHPCSGCSDSGCWGLRGRGRPGGSEKSSQDVTGTRPATASAWDRGATPRGQIAWQRRGRAADVSICRCPCRRSGSVGAASLNVRVEAVWSSSGGVRPDGPWAPRRVGGPPGSAGAERPRVHLPPPVSAFGVCWPVPRHH